MASFVGFVAVVLVDASEVLDLSDGHAILRLEPVVKWAVLEDAL